MWLIVLTLENVLSWCKLVQLVTSSKHRACLFSLCRTCWYCSIQGNLKRWTGEALNLSLFNFEVSFLLDICWMSERHGWNIIKYICGFSFCFFFVYSSSDSLPCIYIENGNMLLSNITPRRKIWIPHMLSDNVLDNSCTVWALPALKNKKVLNLFSLCKMASFMRTKQ